MLSTKEVCSECLHNLSSNYQHRISEWGERKRASAPADKSSANMQECTEKPRSQHTSTGRLSTNCRQMLQEHVVFFQSKIQCISGNFCLKKKKKNFENISRKNWMYLKNGPLSVKKNTGQTFYCWLITFPFRWGLLTSMGIMKMDKCSLYELHEKGWQSTAQ